MNTMSNLCQTTLKPPKMSKNWRCFGKFLPIYVTLGRLTYTISIDMYMKTGVSIASVSRKQFENYDF